MTEITSTKGKWRRRILVFLVASTLLLLIIRTGAELWASRKVNEAVARLEQRYGSLDGTTLSAPQVPADDNRARSIRGAAALLAGRSDVLWGSMSRFLSQRTQGPVPADLRTFIEANEAALRVVDDARQRSQSSWETDYLNNVNPPPWLDIRMLSNAIYFAARLDLEAGRADAAAGRITSGLALSASIRQEPAIIAQLLRCSFALQQFDAVQRLVTHTEPSTAALQDVARWLAENRFPDPMSLGLLMELKYANEGFKRLEQGDASQVLWIIGRERTPFWVGPVAWLARPVGRIYRLHSLEQIGRLLDVQAGPRPRPDLARERENWSWIERTAAIAVPGLERTMDTGDLFNSALGLSELGVALRRYRLDSGQYPDALPALVPAYIASVPIDPVTGQPPVYTRQGTGFELRADKVKNTSAQMATLMTWKVPK